MKTVLFALIFTSCVVSLFAVECYNCIYAASYGESCMDPFNASSSQPTTSCDGSCTKTFTRVDGEITGLVRTCSPGPSCPAETCATVGNTEGCVYCCTGDKCNGASTVTFGLMTAGVTAVAAWINSAW